MDILITIYYIALQSADDIRTDEHISQTILNRSDLHRIKITTENFFFDKDHNC